MLKIYAGFRFIFPIDMCCNFCCTSSSHRDFRQTIFVLQGDIETLEAEKVDLEKKLKLGPTHYPDTKHGPKIRMVGPTSSSSPFLSRKAPSSSMIEEFSGDDSSTTTDQSPLLLARVRVIHYKVHLCLILTLLLYILFWFF